MVFASGTFIFIFLPVTLAGYWLIRNKSINIRNIYLLVMSVGFYLNSGLRQLILLAISILVNYFFALLISVTEQKKELRKMFLILAVIYNIGVLFVYKYLTFVCTEVLKLSQADTDSVPNILLPLGISFYTFQALSYVIDVYKNSDLVEKKIVNVALYISFFPQLIAGPIVRWNSIRDDLRVNTLGFSGGQIDSGLQRFVIGLGKKVILANQMAIFADKAFYLQASGNLTTFFSWIGAIAYTLQIYYDFSGYSDMAIGLGRIFGFSFPENFNYPYISQNITEFWRRWHISLSSWFRDYVYIPLGGNRCSKKRIFFNLFVVWGMTGIWHGANYTFWLWGVSYFVLLVIEKIFKAWIPNFPLKKVIGHLYTMFFVVLLWVVFKADNMSVAIDYIGIMFGKNASNSIYANGVTWLYFRNMIGFGLIAVIGCAPWKIVVDKMKSKIAGCNFSIVRTVGILAIFIIACCMTLDGDYNPFVYFNF